jgi:hypothetical protein
MEGLAEMGKQFGVISTFTNKDLVALFIAFFSQFHVAASAVSCTINMICFLNFFINSYVHTSDDLKVKLHEVKQLVDRHHKNLKRRANAEVKKNLSLEARTKIGKYIDSTTYKKALDFAKEKAGSLEHQVRYYFFLSLIYYIFYFL